jgi:DNA-binding IclR family transcriptional regulator
MKEDRHFVTALARGLAVLACFRSSDRVLSNQEIARRCRLAKSTVSRLTHTLTKLGYLIQLDHDGRYALGTATLSLGSAMLARLNVRALARPAMQALADFSHATMSMGTYAQLHMIYVEHCRSHEALTLALDVGSRIPVATSAIGRAYLTALGPEARDEVLAQVRDHDPKRWPKLRAAVNKAVADYAELGCCTSFGDWQPDINGIAVHFRQGESLPPMALNCGGLASTLTPKFLLKEVRPRLIRIARDLEEALGTRR